MKAKIELNKGEVDRLRRLLDLGTDIDFEREGVEKDALLLIKNVKFDDGCFADLKVCSGQSNLWCEMVFFDPEGNEIHCVDDDSGEILGEFDDSMGHEVEVVAK